MKVPTRELFYNSLIKNIKKNDSEILDMITIDDEDVSYELDSNWGEYVFYKVNFNHPKQALLNEYIKKFIELKTIFYNLRNYASDYVKELASQFFRYSSIYRMFNVKQIPSHIGFNIAKYKTQIAIYTEEDFYSTWKEVVSKIKIFIEDVVTFLNNTSEEEFKETFETFDYLIETFTILNQSKIDDEILNKVNLNKKIKFFYTEFYRDWSTDSFGIKKIVSEVVLNFQRVQNTRLLNYDSKVSEIKMLNNGITEVTDYKYTYLYLMQRKDLEHNPITSAFSRIYKSFIRKDSDRYKEIKKYLILKPANFKKICIDLNY